MRYLLIMSVGCVLTLAGCGRPAAAESASSRPTASDQPIDSGKLIRVTMWHRPVQRPGESGTNESWTESDGRVRIYPNFILVTDSHGTTRLSPHGWYTDLVYESDAR